jgi:hypothetical protein
MYEYWLTKRIQREIKTLVKFNICNSEDDIEITEKMFHNTSIRIYIIEFISNKDNKSYKFKITSDYPFECPKLYINNKLFDFYEKSMKYGLLRTNQRYREMGCFTSQPIITQWKIHYIFMDLLRTYDACRESCRRIYFVIIVDIIKRKYLIDDINIIEWLY